MEAIGWTHLAAAAAGYLLGSIPFGLILTRLAGDGDLRAIGSGNIGATNVLRTGNKAAAAGTLLLDGGKGAVAVLLARWPADRTRGVPLAGGDDANIRMLAQAGNSFCQQRNSIAQVRAEPDQAVAHGANPKTAGPGTKNGGRHEHVGPTAVNTTKSGAFPRTLKIKAWGGPPNHISEAINAR